MGIIKSLKKGEIQFLKKIYKQYRTRRVSKSLTLRKKKRRRENSLKLVVLKFVVKKMKLLN